MTPLVTLLHAQVAEEISLGMQLLLSGSTSAAALHFGKAQVLADCAEYANQLESRVAALERGAW